MAFYHTKQLPQELTDHIIDYVASDPGSFLRCQTLKNCSLTCHRWRTRAQFHLFRYQWVNSPAKLQKVLDLSRDARIPAYLRVLHIEPLVYFRADLTFASWWAPPLQAFAQLRDVRLLNVFLKDDLPLRRAGAVSTSLTQLSLWKFRAPTCQSVTELLHELPNLQHLKLERTLWHCQGFCKDHLPAPERPAAAALPRPRLTRLTADNYFGYVTLGCLAKHLDLSRLERLSVVFHRRPDEISTHPLIFASHPILDQVLSAAKHSLQAAWFEVPDLLDELLYTGIAADFFGDRGLEMPAVRELTFLIDLLDVTMPYDWILRTLEIMDPSRLRTLTLVMRVDHSAQLVHVDWSHLESVLLSPPFKSFSELVIAVPPAAYHGPDLEEITMLAVPRLQRALEAHLPTLVKERSLRVETSKQTACMWNDLPI